MGQGRSIAFVTGTRADYGIARWILQDIADDPAMTLQLIVTGSHLDVDRGNTLEEILNDGFLVDRLVTANVSDDSPVAAAGWMSECLQGLTAALRELQPDLLLLVGDRFEALIAAQAAMLARIPVAHVHGGEITAGSLDEGMRHAITKLSHLHFAATDDYGRRIVQLGEQPASVHVVGSPGLCALDRDADVPADEVEAILGFALSEPYILVTYHPPTSQSSAESVQGAVAIVDALTALPELRVVITGVNVDPGFAAIRGVFEDFASRTPERVTLIESLGHRRYLRALRSARACVGNSSSGIIEAPALGVPTVNVGDRQHGRLRADSVIDTAPEGDDVFSAIALALTPEFVRKSEQQLAPYGSGGASRRIVQILRNVSLSRLLEKSFRDCGPGCDSWTALEGGFNDD